MELGEIPELPKLNQKKLINDDEEFILDEFRKGKNKFIFYDTEENEPRFYFHKLDENLFAALVHLLSQKSHDLLYEFLKLGLEAARFNRQNNKKGFLLSERVLNYIKDDFQRR